MESIKGFVVLVKEQNPNIISIYCFLHKETLVGKRVGKELKSVLDQFCEVTTSKDLTL